MSDLDKILDADGRAMLSVDLRTVFLFAGCDPACHICGNPIKVGSLFRLKPIAKRGDTTATAMVCDKCDKANRRLDIMDAWSLIGKAGLDEADLIPGTTKNVKPSSRSFRERPPYSGCHVVWRDGKAEVLPGGEESADV